MIRESIAAANAEKDTAQPTIPDVLPCQSCGLGIARAEATSIALLTIEGPKLASTGMSYDAEVFVGRCPRCGARRDRAAVLLAQYPKVQAVYGDPALDKVDSLLMALEILGDRKGKLAEQLVTSAQSLYDATEALAGLGSAAYWARFHARPGAFESHRWAHVSGELVTDIRAAHLALLRRPFERNVPVTPPAHALRGCALCGVGTVVVRESDSGSAWGTRLTFPGAVFGVSGDVAAHLCPECSTDFEAVGGAIGMPVLWRALVRSRGYAVLPGRVVTGVSGVRPWCALPLGTAPNTERFGHVDTAGVDRMLARSADVRRIAE